MLCVEDHNVIRQLVKSFDFVQLVYCNMRQIRESD